MKVVTLTFLFTLILQFWSNSVYTDNFSDNLNRDLTDLLDNDDYSLFHTFNKHSHHKSTDRKLAKIEYKKLQRKYNHLKKKYERLLILYKTKGYLAHETPTQIEREIDISRLPKKHARRLVKLKKLAQKHQRKMEDCEEHHHFYEGTDYTPSDGDSWLTSAVKNTASAFGIQNGMDMITAGAGAGALTYGVHHRNKSRDTKRKIALQMQKAYVLKEGVAKMLTREIRKLGTLVGMIEDASRRVTRAGDNICANIDAKSLYMGGPGY